MIKDLIEEQKKKFDEECVVYPTILSSISLPVTKRPEIIRDFLTEAMTLAYEAGGRDRGEKIKQNFKTLCTINNDGDCKYFKDELHNDLRDGAKFIAQHILDEILALTPDQLNNERE